ncbi:MAG: caspase family protein [Pseudomonadota bacterium]
MKWLVAFLLAVFAIPLSAQERLALVIGNDRYTSVVDLQKAVADAEAVSDKLRELGFETIEGLNLDRRGMNERISEFTSRLNAGDTAFVFFAGHGVEIDGENYLLPTDIVAPTSGETDFVKSESIALSNLLDRVRATGARTSIAIVDACRDNPFDTVAGRSVGKTRGLGRINAPEGMFVIFSAGAGQMALDRLSDDEAARNSVFTRALLPRLSQPGLELRSMVADLRREVRDLSRTVQHTQIPAYYDELLGEFYFTPASLADTVPEDRTAQGPETMRADFELARSVGTVTALDSFLEKYAAQSEDYTYEVALQLRDTLADNTVTDPVERVPVETTSAPVISDSREVMRATQAALNALGCNAGGADGVAGPRTRSAFAGYLSASGSQLGADDLGTRHALAELQGKSGTVCETAVSAPRSTGAQEVSMAGTWQFKATCVVVVKVTGTVRYSRAGANKYTGRLTDSLGQTANTEIFLNEQQLTGTDYFPGVTVQWRGRLADDGNSFTSSGSTGCSVYAWRVG